MTLFYDDELAEALAAADIVDLFAGPGGWSEALHMLGQADIGIELDRWACATRRAAGHGTIEANVAHTNPHDYTGARGLIASPPCPAFSNAGNRLGRQYLEQLAEAITDGAWWTRPHHDPDVWLTLEVGRWAEALRPQWIALEQVPAALPLWEAYARIWRTTGYHVWTGVLNAADYGVPQTRSRAILIAHRDRPADMPPPTHSKTGDARRAPWVTMAEALGIDEPFTVGFPSLDDRGDSPNGYRERDLFPSDGPAPTVTEKARSWTLNTGRDWKPGGSRDDCQRIDMDTEPAPSLTAKSGGQWWLERPATTIAGDSRVFPPGGHIAHDGRDNTNSVGRSEGAIQITITDALRLQSFRPDYPVRGTKTKAHEQIGNAVPPLLATHILRQIV